LLFGVAIFLGCLAFPRGTLAQTELAGVYGRVTDQSGAVIVDAEVEIKNVETNQSIIVKTNQDGLYTIPSLHPGHYLISARKPGFKTVTVTELELNIQDNVVRNFALQVGSIAETVTITADQNNINTTDASVSTVVDQTYVKNMPLNGRSFQDLILLTPGVVTNSPQTGGTLGQTGEFSVNGQRTESNSYTVDGVSANVGAAAGLNMVTAAGSSGSLPASTALGTTQALVSVDDLQEFRVQSSTYSAEYGRNPGGQFAFETKSGTNQVHGTAYDYLRNGFFDAPDWFNNYFGVKQPALRQNDFGGTLGGPFEIPGLYKGKDKTFFFVSYEGLRLSAPQAASVQFVPDLCMRGMGTCPSGRKSAPSALQQALNAFPLPSPGGIDDTVNGFAQFIGSWSNPSSLNSTSVRVDHAVNDKLRLFFRFSDTGSRAASRRNPATQNNVSAYTLRIYTGGISSVFSSRLSNQFRINRTSNEAAQSDTIDAFGGSTPVDLAQVLGLNPGSWPIVSLQYHGYSPTFFQDHNSGAQTQLNLVDTVVLSLGRHQFRVGGDYRRLAPFAVPTTPLLEYFYISESSVETNSAFTFPKAFAPAHPLYQNFSLFAQDEWKVAQRLSLSLGMRWEVNPAPGVTQGSRPYAIQGSDPKTWALAPQGTPLWQTTWYNFAPRIGAAYVLHNAPGRETVVRGGGGVFFDTGQQLGSLGFNGPGFATSGPFISGSFPVAPTIPTVVNPPVGKQGTVYAFAQHLQLPYALQWNASIEQALGQSQAVTLSYVGAHGGRLLKNSQVSSPSSNPNVGTVVLIGNGLSSDYDSLQGQFQRRLSRGATVLASYTWSHCLDYGSQNFAFGYQRGNCNFDVRHNLSAALSYDVPNVGHNGLVNAVLHHWGLDDRFSARTAFPVTLDGRGFTDPATLTFYHAGLNLVPGQPIYLYGANCAAVLQGLKNLNPGQGCPGGRAINPQAFADVSSGLGNAPRDFVRGFGAWQMDLAVRRDFPIHEALKLQFRADAFNTFNHPNFGTINAGFGQSTFGQATSTLAGSLGILSPLYQQGGPRSMQFSLKLVF